MSAAKGSVFDLSPAEKLQLVEDLWDDLAASSESAPVHDWQKKELTRRKANLRRNPGSGLAWEEVKRRVRRRRGRAQVSDSRIAARDSLCASEPMAKYRADGRRSRK